jgi:16S rRNA (cytidine1402-2'-O)-methyltransferase
MPNGILYIVATPIGNLGDLTLRAVDTLKAVDAIFCEDTRQTAKLMAHLGVKKALFAYHQHSGERATSAVATSLREGMSVALVSDAGTPGINDPGGKLIADLLRELPELKIVPIPGPNAAVAALSVSGFPADRYLYLGFAPHKKGRETFFRKLAEHEDTVVFYESKHRIVRALSQLTAALDSAGTPERPVLVARELTKQFETLYRGTVAAVSAAVGEGAKGEFVVVLGPRNWKSAASQ